MVTKYAPGLFSQVKALEDGEMSQRGISIHQLRDITPIGFSTTKNQKVVLQYVMRPGPWFNIKMSSYRYRKSHCGDKTVVRSSYLHNGISYTGKMTSLYWFSPLILQISITKKMSLSLWTKLTCLSAPFPSDTRNSKFYSPFVLINYKKTSIFCNQKVAQSKKNISQIISWCHDNMQMTSGKPYIYTNCYCQHLNLL